MTTQLTLSCKLNNSILTIMTLSSLSYSKNILNKFYSSIASQFKLTTSVVSTSPPPASFRQLLAAILQMRLDS